MSNIPLGDLKKLLNKRIFGRAVLGREPYVFREPMRDEKGLVVGYTPKIIGVSYQYVILMCPAPKTLVVSGRAIGKSGVLIGNDVPHTALIQPHFDQAYNYLTRPLPSKTILIGNLRETSRKLQEQVRRDCMTHHLLQSLVAEHTQTYLRSKGGSEVFVRTAGNDGSSVRGLHSEILTNERGESVKGRIYVKYDEAAFSRAPNLIREVIEPMMLLNPASRVQVTTTPYGEEGEVYAAWSDAKSMDCLQPYNVQKMFVERSTGDGMRYYREEPFRVYPGFDPALCKRCLAKPGWKRFNIATAENPFVVPELLQEQKRSLERSGLDLVWNQEHMGLFQKAAGLFIPPALWMKMIDDESTLFDEQYDLRNFPGRRRGKFFVGFDSSSGVVTKGSDFSALAVWEEVRVKGEAHYFLRLIHRWRRPPEVWNSTSYDENKLLRFIIDYVKFLVAKIDVAQVTVGFGFGQGVYTALQDEGNVRLEYYTDSETELTAGFVWLRALGGLGRIHIPPECAPGGPYQWLTDEAGRLGVTDGGSGTSGLRFKVYKTSGWGTGKTVDGLFAMMYGLKPTLGMSGEIGGVTVRSTIVGPDRRLGPDRREVGGGRSDLAESRGDLRKVS